MLKRKAAACVTAAARSTAEPVQMQAQAAEAIEAASSLGVEGDAVDLAAIADDLPQLQQMLLRQWQTVKDCERQMTKIKKARTVSGGGSGGGRRAKKEDAAYKLYEKKRDAALRVISGSSRKDMAANDLALEDLVQAIREGGRLHARYGTRPAAELRGRPAAHAAARAAHGAKLFLTCNGQHPSPPRMQRATPRFFESTIPMYRMCS